jgi:predicted nucleic acid-binding Zn ribbon protein
MDIAAIPSVAMVAEVLALAPRPQPWRYEAPARHVIRGMLCRQGDKWWHADRVAFVLVARARILLNVRAPVGGDSDYDLSSRSGSADCAVCDRRFIPRRRDQETCSDACRRRQRYLETQPVHLRRCAHCRDPMDVQHPSQRYCSTRCQKAVEYLRNRKEWGRVRHCRTCGGPIPDSLRGDGAYCSVVCRNKWNREIPGRVEARREAYRQAAGLVVRSNCIECGKPLPDGSNARRKYCSNACNTAAHRARKGNGHAPNGHAHATATNGSCPDHRSDHAGGEDRDHHDHYAAAAGPPGEPAVDAARTAS